MKTYALLLPLTAALISAAPRLDTTLAFAVPEKTKLVRSIVADSEMESTKFSMSMDGQDLPDEIAKEFKLTFKNHEEIEVTDEFVGVKDGSVTKMQRTFDTLKGTMGQTFEGPGGQGNKESNEDKTSPLEGKSVVFTRDGDDFKVAFADGEGDEELLAGLEQDLDLAKFLPTKAVADDATWEIEPSAFAVLIEPAGRVKLRTERAKDEDNKLSSALIESLKGKAHGKLKGVRDEGGAKVAEIAIDAELTATGSDERADQGSMTMAMEITVEGTLLWDVKAGHARSLELTTKNTSTMKIEASLEMGAETHESKQQIDLAGKDTLKITVKAGE
jgi:hypothetical protein